MLSCHTSRRSSLAKVVVKEPSKSVPATPAKLGQRPIFRTVPDSPQHHRLVSEDHGLDLDILTHKLQLYQLEVEEADLRMKQKREMESKQAAEIAAAARFRDELDTNEVLLQMMQRGTISQHSRSVSAHLPESTIGPGLGLSSTATPQLVRSRRPQPLHLSTASVQPQEVQSAALPSGRDRSLKSTNNMKKHWRRTTISASHNPHKIVMVTSPGKLAEFDFLTEVPLVPQLSHAESSTGSPSIVSPVTPKPTEDQIRRELETFALEEGPNIDHLSRRSSISSRKPLPPAFIPALEDRVKRAGPGAPAALVKLADDLFASKMPGPPALTRKKSFFNMFERKNDVDDLLNLYMTEEQLLKEKEQGRKSVKSRRQTFFKRWQLSENLPHKSEKPA